ncbi:hypothetical protein lerEdw1_012750, partial [Lerista edwardsae]
RRGRRRRSAPTEAASRASAALPSAPSRPRRQRALREPGAGRAGQAPSPLGAGGGRGGCTGGGRGLCLPGRRGAPAARTAVAVRPLAGWLAGCGAHLPVPAAGPVPEAPGAGSEGPPGQTEATSRRAPPPPPRPGRKWRPQAVRVAGSGERGGGGDGAAATAAAQREGPGEAEAGWAGRGGAGRGGGLRGGRGGILPARPPPSPASPSLSLQLRDFLLVYNRMTERCFQRCVASLAHRGLSRDEEACLDRCAGKLVRSSHRLMAAYVQLMPSIVQRRIADYEPPGPEDAPGPLAAGCGEPIRLPGARTDRAWAWPIRQRLATQLREAGRAEPKQVDVLVAELIAVFGAVLWRSSRQAWVQLLEALRLLAPFQALLAERAELAPYLESLYYQYRSSQALVADLDVLGALGQAFSQGRPPVLGAPSQVPGPQAPAGPAAMLLSAPHPVFAALPCPFTASWALGEASGVLRPDPVSLQELQRCVGLVGSAVAQGETPWASSLSLMPLTLATDLPAEFPCAEASGREDDGTARRPLKPGTEVPGPAPVSAAERGLPLTGLQAAEVFARNWHVGRIQFLYFNVAPNRHFRPYDLVAVPKRLSSPLHYIFSGFGVLRVHPEEGAEAISLGAWHREALLWQLLQHIPFFRLFLVRKAFLRWYDNVKHLQYLKRREMLRGRLLQAVPHFGAALLHISRLLQELRSVHWLPVDDSRCYEFPELKWALAQENSSARALLGRFLTFCTCILELVRDDTYRMVHGLQVQVQDFKLYVTKDSLHHQRRQLEGLRRRLRDSEASLQKLGFLAMLVNLLIGQNLVSAVQEEVTAFVTRTMKADGISRKAVIRVQLIFNADNQLMLFPSSTELEACLMGAISAVVESVMQGSWALAWALGWEEVAASVGDPVQTRWLCHPTASRMGDARWTLKQLQQQPAGGQAGEEPQLVHRLDLRTVGGLEVVGHRLRVQYPILSWGQLQKDLQTDSIIQKAVAKQWALLTAALTETQQLCQEYSWLTEICAFVHSWGPSRLESMKGWPAEEYVNCILKLRTWVSQVQKVPQVVTTYNCLLFVDCSGIHQDETVQRSELLIAELTSVLQLYMTLGTDIFTIARCSQKVPTDDESAAGDPSNQLEQYQGQMPILQEHVDYVRALNEVIQQCFRPLTPSEESLENTLLDTWDAFTYQHREVSDFIISRRLSIIAELSSSLQEAMRELHELLATVTVGRFQDPAQNPRDMEEALRQLNLRFQATVVRITDLCRSQRILTGDCMDVSFISTSQGVIDVHRRIWQLFRVVSEQILEWKCLAFVKFNTALAMEKTEEWQKEALSIQHCLPGHHPVLQACLRAISNFQKYLPLLLMLGSSFLKLGCWKEIFAVMGVKCPLNMQFTLGQLLSYPLLEHSEAIFRVYASEKSRQYSQDALLRLQRLWVEKQFRLVNFILDVPYQEPHPERFRRPASGRQRPAKVEYISKDSGTYVLSDTAALKAAVEQGIQTLQNMILSPYSSDIQEEAESWASTLRAVESLLDAWVTFQQKWVFLNIVQYEMNIILPSAELDLRFQQLDTYFREFMQATCHDPLVLSSVRPAVGSSRDVRFVGSFLQAGLAEGSADLQGIIQALDYVLEATRMSFPRLFFLSNEELIALLATASEPADASAWAQRCFPGVRQLQVVVPSAAQKLGTLSAQVPASQVTGLVGEQGEKLKLCSLVALSRKPTQWLCALEQRMKESVFLQLQACLAQRLALRPQLDLAFEKRPGPTDLPLHLVAEHWAMLGNSFPSQCMLVAEEALWHVAVEEALLSPGGQPRLSLKLGLKQEALAHYLRNYRSAHAWQPEGDHLGMMLGALLIATLQQRDVFAQLLRRQVCSLQAFEWAQRLKYRVALQPEKARAARDPPDQWLGSPPGCWAEFLGSRLPYDYEYLGPCLRLLGSPALDRTFLGLLLAMEEFRCGGLLGRPGVGRSHTVQGLAQALGRQLVTLSCSAQTSVSCLSRHLSGAVHAGALLLLEAAERLALPVLSAFSQCLVDLQRLCLSLREGGRGAAAAHASAEASSAMARASTGSPESESSESEDEVQPAVTLPELGTDEAEPYHPRVLGNILFGGRLLRVRETFGCVATLGYLPEPLRLALRPLALLPPDMSQLAEATLLAAGFREAVRLAEKLAAFFRLEGQLGPAHPASRPALLRKVIQVAIGIAFSIPAGHEPSPATPKPSARTAFFLGLEEEPAVVRALCLSPLLSGPECPRLQLVRGLLREVFPSASSQLPEPPSALRLQHALVAQLHEDKLHPEPRLLSTACQLSQAAQSAPGVLLLGPSGSGKTVIWRTLAKALSRLAASDAAPAGPESGPQRTALFQPTSTVCLWPNGLTLAELVGSLEGGAWTEGVLSRLLQRAATSSWAGETGAGSSQQWLVLDGTACAEWLEPLSSLFDAARPALSLPSGQRLQLPRSVKFLFEMPEASGVSPSVCTHCALVHCSGDTLWPTLLAAALAPLYRRYCLTQESLTMLRELAEELFPATLRFLQQHCCSVLLPHSGPRNPMAHGVQETSTFARILHGLLEQYLRRDRVKFQPASTELTGEAATAQPSRVSAQAASASRGLDDAVPAHHHLLTQSFFAFAYIWGFGGHLQPRHRALFGHFARQALGNSRFCIELPPGVPAFDLCPVPESGALQPFDGRYLSNRVKGIPASFSILPQYERVLFVADLLLGTDQPLLLVGEPGCGKSSFAETLLQPNYFYHRLGMTPALRAAHLRQVLHRKSLSATREKGLFPGGKQARAVALRGRCLFFVEDLHMVPLDPARGTSPVTETLRQALTHQQFYHPETLELQHCPAPGFNCFGTLSVPGAGAPPLCPRFGRLFSLVALPLATRESLLNMHVPVVLAWLEKFPVLTRHNDVASGLVRATVDAYETVRSRFQPSPACCLLRFSLHHVQKVFRGMFVLRPRPGIHLSSPLEELSPRMVSSRRSSTAGGRVAVGTGYTVLLSVRLIVRLWLHEAFRTFCDPLRGERQRELCGQLLLEIATTTFCAKHSILRVVPSSGAPAAQQPSRARVAFRAASTSRSCITEAIVEEEEEEAEGAEAEQELLQQLSARAEHDLPGGSEADHPDPWDPVERAPVLALDPPDPAPSSAPPLEDLEADAPEAEEVEMVKKRSSAFQLGAAERHRVHEPQASHIAPQRGGLLRAKRRTPTKKEGSGPLLPAQLLLLPGESARDIVFSKDLGPELHWPGAHNPFQEKLWKTLEQQLAPLLSPEQLLSSQGLRHVVRLSRLLCGPDRHGALLASGRCTGRQTLVSMAAQATAALLVRLPEKAGEEQAQAVLRLASWQAGILGKQVLLLVPASVPLATLHLVLALMMEGTCPGLYSPEDTAGLIQALLQENQTIKRSMRDELILQRFFHFVRANLHVLLLLGGSEATALPPVAATILSQSLCSLEVHKAWSTSSLQEVAYKRLMGNLNASACLTQVPASSLLHSHKELVHRLARAAAWIHSSASIYATYLAAHLPLVTPRSFLDFLDVFVLLLSSLQEQNSKLIDRMKLALFKMGEVSKKQQEHTRDARVLQQKLAKIKEQVAQYQQEVERQQIILKEQEKECQVFEARINTLAKERDALERKKELAMKKMSKEYKQAMAALREQDIEELRGYRRPPALVVKVTDVLCLMFGQEPGWESAKQLLSREDFYQELVFYPKDNLSDELFASLRRLVVGDRAFNVANVQSASRAAAALCQWIRAIYWYHWALRDWQPTMEQLQQCDARINMEKLQLGDRRLHSQYLRDTTHARIRELKQKQEHQEKLVQQLTQSLQAKEEAATLESSVAEHMSCWSALTKASGSAPTGGSGGGRGPGPAGLLLLGSLGPAVAILWLSPPQGLEHHQSTAFGDALLCVAALTYLGPFPPQRREELLEKWQAMCAGAQVSQGPDDISRLLQRELPCPGPAPSAPPVLLVQQPFSLVSLLSSPPEQRIWDRAAKPKDPDSRLAAILLRSGTHARAHRWPLLVDPDRQALVWLLLAGALDEEESRAFVLSELVPDMVEQGSNEEIPEDNLTVASLTDPDLEQTLRNAAGLGLPVLLMDFEKSTPWCPTLQQLMEKEALAGAEGGLLLQVESKEDILVPASFQLYLCTSLPLEALAEELDQALLKRLNVLDLRLSPGALEELLLAEVLRVERREILKHRQALQLGVLQLEGKLEATEVRRGWAGGLWHQWAGCRREDRPASQPASQPALPPRAARSLARPLQKELVDLISQPQRSLLEEENFMPMVRLLQTQIQALQATHQHMVSQYQHQAALCDKYRPVAHLGVALYLALQQVARLHPLYSFTTDTCISHTRQALFASKRLDPSKQETLPTRLLELGKAVLRQLLSKALPCLREMDRLLYGFLGALATLRVVGQLRPIEWLAFCGGLREPAARALLQPPPADGDRLPCPGWVSPGAWEECRLLESLPGFQGLLGSLSEKAGQWQEYFRLPSTVVGLALCPSHAHLSPFQRAILWRILCPGALSRVVEDLTTCLLGWSLAEEVANINAYAYSRASKPIIFLTPPASEPGSFTHPLHWIQQMAAQRGRSGKVVVISFGTLDAAKRVWRTLPLCTRKGKWLVLNNCHLQAHWDPRVLAQLDLLLSSQGGANEGGALEIHPKFRLWLITTTDAPHSVPGPVHRNAVILFCDMPLELRGILACTYRLLQGQVPGLESRLRLALLTLYATLLYRQSYAQWTQAAVYMWSQGELLAGFKAQEKLSWLTDNAEEALQELAGTMLYGGHILDSGDAEAVQSLCRQCLATGAPPKAGSGFANLLAAVHGINTPELSEEEAVAATQAQIQHLPSPMEPAWVGVCSGLQQRMLAARSEALLAALLASQGLWQPRSPPSSRQAALEQLVQQGLLLVQELQEQLQQRGWELGEKGRLLGARPKPRPLQHFLLGEAGCFLALLQQVEKDLRCAQERLQEAACSSPRCAAILHSLEQDQLPHPWLLYSPTGPQPPQAWLETLRLRCQLLCSYLDPAGGQRVPLFNLAAFQHPRRLFTALLEEKARAKKQELERYHLVQQILPSLLPPSNVPDQGLYLSGLELHHALWNLRSGQLQETASAQPCQMPTLWVQAKRQPGEASATLPTYHCPVYLGAAHMPVSLHSARAVLHVPLPSKMPLDLCAQLRVHIISLLQ